MHHSRSVQYAYKKRSFSFLPCGVCRSAFLPGQLYTLHQAPDFSRVDARTNRFAVVAYAACEFCAPFTPLESETGELDIRAFMKRELDQSNIPVDQQDTLIQVPIVRKSTPRPLRSVVQPSGVPKRIALVEEVL
jgi:hypothetical protein